MATTDAAAGAEIQLKPARTSMAAPRGPTGPPRLATVVDREKVIIHMHYYPPTHSRYLARFPSLFEAVVSDSQDRSSHKIRLGL